MKRRMNKKEQRAYSKKWRKLSIVADASFLVFVAALVIIILCIYGCVSDWQGVVPGH